MTPTPPDRGSPMTLETLWMTSADQIKAELDGLVEQVGAVVADPSTSVDAADKAEWTAHRLAGVFAAFERPDQSRTLRSLSDALHRMRDGERVDLEALHTALVTMRRDTWQ